MPLQTQLLGTRIHQLQTDPSNPQASYSEKAQARAWLCKADFFAKEIFIYKENLTPLQQRRFGCQGGAVLGELITGCRETLPEEEDRLPSPGTFVPPPHSSSPSCPRSCGLTLLMRLRDASTI